MEDPNPSEAQGSPRPKPPSTLSTTGGVFSSRLRATGSSVETPGEAEGSASSTTAGPPAGISSEPSGGTKEREREGEGEGERRRREGGGEGEGVGGVESRLEVPGRKKRERVTWGGVQSVTAAGQKIDAIPLSMIEASAEQSGSTLTSHDYRLYSPGSSFPSSMGSSPSGGQVETVIDGRYSVNSKWAVMNDDGDFEHLEAPAISTSEALSKCKNRVLNPYMWFLKTIGWRRFRSANQDLEQPCRYKCINLVYPSVFFVLLLYTCISQIVSCYFRTVVVGNTTTNDAVNGTVVLIQCNRRVLTTSGLQAFFVLVSYLLGIYVFRFSEREKLSTLMETVFIGYTNKHVKRDLNHLIITLQVFLLIGLLWVLFSFLTSVMRLVTLQLLWPNTYIHWLDRQYPDPPDDQLLYNVFRYLLVLSSLLGFVVFDLLYVAVVINYVTQCQLIVFYVRSIVEKVKTKGYNELTDSLKEIRKTYEFLQTLNGNVSAMTTILFYIFLFNLVDAYMVLRSIDSEVLDSSISPGLVIVVAICNVIQWAFITVVPVAQASRLTSEFRSLRRLGLEIASRPFLYADESHVILDTFLLYTTSTRYTAKLIAIPIYPMYVFGALFIVAILIGFGVIGVPALEWL